MSQSQDVQQKLQQLKTYIPFVERIVHKLESRGGGAHLDKLRGLYKFLINPDTKLQNVEMLDRMEKIINDMVKSAASKPSTISHSSTPTIEDKPKERVRERRESGGHRKQDRSSRDRRDDRSHRSYHRDHYSSRNRRSRSREKDYSRLKDRNERQTNYHQSSHRISDFGNSSSTLPSHKETTPKLHEKSSDVRSFTEKSLSKVSDDSSLKEKERRLFGDDDSLNQNQDSTPVIPKEPIKIPSLLELPMPPGHHESFGSGISAKPYQGAVDNLTKTNNLEVLNARMSLTPDSNPKEVFHNMNIIKSRLGISEHEAKRQFQFDQSSLSSLHINENNSKSLFPAYKSDTSRISSPGSNTTNSKSSRLESSNFLSNVPSSSRAHSGTFTTTSNVRDQVNLSKDLQHTTGLSQNANRSRSANFTSRMTSLTNSRSQIPSIESSSLGMPNNVDSYRSQNAKSKIATSNDPRSPTHSIKPIDIPMATYPHISHDNAETPQSPDNEASFSPDLSDDGAVKTIPLENEDSELPEGRRLPSVNMDAIQKALNFINSHDKRPEARKIAYRYEDFVGPAATSNSDYYDPVESWQESEDKFGGKDVDLRSKDNDMDLRTKDKDMDLRNKDKDMDLRNKDKDIDLRNKDKDVDLRSKGKDVDLRHKDVDLRQIPGQFIPPQPISDIQFQNVHKHSALSDTDTRYSVISSKPFTPNLNTDTSWYAHDGRRSSLPSSKEPKDVDMRSLMCGSPQQTFGTSHPKYSSSLQPTEPKENTERTASVVKPELSKKIEPSKLDIIRNRIAHDQDKLIKLGQKGVAQLQAESYKQKREKHSMPSKTPPLRRYSDSADSASTTAKKSTSVTVLDELIPETEEEKRLESPAKEDLSHKSTLSKAEVDIITKYKSPIDADKKSKSGDLDRISSHKSSLPLRKGEPIQTSRISETSLEKSSCDSSHEDLAVENSTKDTRTDQLNRLSKCVKKDNASRDPKSDMGNRIQKVDVSLKDSRPDNSRNRKIVDLRESTIESAQAPMATYIEGRRIDAVRDSKSVSSRDSKTNSSCEPQIGAAPSKTDSPREVNNDSSREKKTDSYREKTAISQESRVNSSPKSKADLSPKSKTDLFQKSKADFSQKSRVDLSQKSKTDLSQKPRADSFREKTSISQESRVDSFREKAAISQESRVDSFREKAAISQESRVDLSQKSKADLSHKSRTDSFQKSRTDSFQKSRTESEESKDHREPRQDSSRDPRAPFSRVSMIDTLREPNSDTEKSRNALLHEGKTKFLQDSRAESLKALKADALRDPRTDTVQGPRTDPVRDPRTLTVRDPRAKFRDHRAESFREPVSLDPRAVSQDPRAVSQDPRAVSQDPRAVSQDPRAVSQDPRAVSQDPRAVSQDPRADFHRNRKTETPYGRSEAEQTRQFDSKFHHIPSGHPGIDPHFEKFRDPRSENLIPNSRNNFALTGNKTPLTNPIKLIPTARDPRLNIDTPRPNIVPDFQRGPRMGPMRDGIYQGFQPPHMQFNLDTRWRPQRMPFPAPLLPPGASKPFLLQPPPGSSPQNSAIGQTFTCLMMQGLLPDANSSHIYKFFEEYLLRDLCIELDDAYRCKGTAYIHFPTHISAKEALEKESEKLLNGYPIYLRICSVGILRQAQATNGVKNFDREKYLNIPQRPSGTGNPFYKPKPKAPPVSQDTKPLSHSNISNQAKAVEPVRKEVAKEEKEGYSNLCGVKLGLHSTKNLQSFKIPKLKKSISQEEPISELKTNKAEEKVEKSHTKASKESIFEAEECVKVTDRKAEVNKKTVKLNEKKVVKGRIFQDTSSSSDSDATIVNVAKKNRRYHKVVPAIDSDSESEKDILQKKSPVKVKTQSKIISDSEDSEDESSLTIDESAPVSSDKDSDSSDTEIQVQESELKPTDRKQLSTSRRGRKKKVVRQPIKNRNRSSFDTKEKKLILSPAKTKRRKNAKRETEMGETKITRLKHVEFKEILSPKRKLRVIIPTPSKLIVPIFSEDKLPKRGPKCSRASPVSPSPSETLSDAASTSTSISQALDVSEVGGGSQKIADTLDSFDTGVSDSDRDLKTTFKNIDSKKRLASLLEMKKPKRVKGEIYSWQNGYKKRNVPMPDIYRNLMKNRKRMYGYVSYKSRKRIKMDLPISKQEEKKIPSCTANDGLASVFDDGILDDNELPDLTQITPSIPESLLPELTSIEGIIRADMAFSEKVQSPSVTSEVAKERIKMISNDLLETAIKFTEQESRERRSGEQLPLVFPNEESGADAVVNEDDEEEANLSLKVDQIVESLDKSISSVENICPEPQVCNPEELEVAGGNLRPIEEENAVCNPHVSQAHISETSESKKTTYEGKEINVEKNKVNIDVKCDDSKSKNVAIEMAVGKGLGNINIDQNNTSCKSVIFTEDNFDTRAKVSSSDVDFDTATNESKIAHNIEENDNEKSYAATNEGKNMANDAKKDDRQVNICEDSKTSAEKDTSVACQADDNKEENYQTELYKESHECNTMNLEKQNSTCKDINGSDIKNSSPANNEVNSSSSSSRSENESLTLITNHGNNLNKKAEIYEGNFCHNEKNNNALMDSTENKIDHNILGFNNQAESIIYKPTINTESSTPITSPSSESDSKLKNFASEKLIGYNSSRENNDNKSVDNNLIHRPQNNDHNSIGNQLTGQKNNTDLQPSSNENIPTDTIQKYVEKGNELFDDMQRPVSEKPFLVTSSSATTDVGAESDVDDSASIGVSSQCSIPDDNSVISNEGREAITPEIPVSSGGKRSKRDKFASSSGLIERRRITRGSLVIPQIAESILWDDGGVVDLFQCDQCDYVGRQRVSHLINFHQEREVPCSFRREDYTPVLRDALGPVYPLPTKKLKLLNWIPKQMIFDAEIECKEKDCDYTSNSRFDFVYHLLEHSPDAVALVFHCRLCNFMSDNLTQFYDHVSSHTGEYRHTCDRCGQKGYSIESLQLHHKDYHGSQSEEIRSTEMVLEDSFPYIHVCRSCHHVQIKLNKMEEHVQYRHNGKADYVKANMSRHLTLHSEKRKEHEAVTFVKKRDGEGISDISVKLKTMKKTLKGKGKCKRLTKKQRVKKKAEVLKIDERKVEDLETEPINESSVSKRDEANLDLEADRENKEFKSKKQDEVSKIDSESRSEANKKNEEAISYDKHEEPEGNMKNDEAITQKDKLETISNETDIKKIIQGDKVEETSKQTNVENNNESIEIIPTNVPVFLGNEKEEGIADEKEKERNVKELVDRILLNNYTSKSSSEIKKKISSLDDILKKVDDSFLENVANLQDSDQSIVSKVDDNVESDRKNGRREEDHDSVFQSTDTQTKEKDFVAPQDKLGEQQEISDVFVKKTVDPQLKNMDNLKDDNKSLNSEEEKQMTLAKQVPVSMQKCKQDSPFALPGIISRLKDNLSKEDVVEKIKEKRLSGCSLSFEEEDSDSDNNLVICEDEEVPKHEKNEIHNIPVVPTQKSGLLRVKPPEQLFPQKQEPKAITGEPLSCIRTTCSYTTLSNTDLTVHSWVKHKMYFCTFADCKYYADFESIYNDHFLTKHQVKKLFCPFHCKTICYPSDLIHHLLDEHQLMLDSQDEDYMKDNFLRIENVRSLDPKSASQIFHSEVVKSPVIVTPEAEVKMPLLIPKKEEFAFPAEETLPTDPPTVPLLQLFSQFQSPRAFSSFTMNKASEVFKCMVMGCTFSTDEPVSFEGHSDNHLTSDHRCCYCLTKLPSGKFLVEHVLDEHSHCSFQCKYCLYRASTKIYLGVHLRKFHPENEPRYIKVTTLRSEPPRNPAIDKFVHPYQCTFPQCSFKSMDTDAFKNHSHLIHGQDVQLKCYFCESYYLIEGLVEHMKVHMMNEYQCPYCLNGESEREKLLTHLLNCHPGRPGKVLLRRQVSGASSGVKPPALSRPSTPALPSVLPVTAAPLPSSVSTTSSTTNAVSTTISGFSSTSPTVTAAHTLIPTTVLTPSEKMKVPSPVVSSALPSCSFSMKEAPLEQTGLTGVALYRCGNEKCVYSCPTQRELKEHLQVCDFSRDSPLLKCYHCAKNFRHLSGLLDHIKVHGPKRYKCGVEGCDYRGTMLHYFKNHMKQMHHHVSFKPVLKDFTNKDPETQEYIVYPKDIASNFKEPHKKRRNEFGVDDIERLPRPPISFQELKCYHCTYSSKVRLNVVKHLKLHKKYPNGIPANSFQEVVKGIPAKQPINPAPRLERKELMFDKMMNLAGSSFEDKRRVEENELRTKHPIPQKEFDKLPGYIPDEKLNSCGIDGCKYLSCDETMLKYHIKTLHSEVEYFTCPHCTDVLVTLDKIGGHFKLHGESLFRCGWCEFLTPRKALVERHLKESHPSKVAFDFCIRGADKEKDDGEVKEGSNPKGGEVVKETPRDGKAPLGFSRLLLPEDLLRLLHEKPPVDTSLPGTSTAPITATLGKNQEPQWQCGICPFRAVVQNEMVNHTTLKHSIKSQYKCGYCQVRSSVRTAFDDHFAAKHPDKQFRVLCMYYRLDSNDIEPLPPGGSTSSHEPLWKRNDPERKRQIRGILIEEDEDDKEANFLNIQPGNPKGEEYVCPKCLSFKTPCLNTFRSHLCKEANYQRFECVECGVTNPLLPSLRRHYTKMHESQFSADCYITLPIESTLEAWVESIISHQQHMIKLWKESETSSNFSSPSKATNKRFSSSVELEAAEVSGFVIHDSGSDKTKYTCTVCGVECKTASGLKSHTTAMHQAKFKCQYCPYSSNTELGISNHRALKHAKLDGSDNKSAAVLTSDGGQQLKVLPEEIKKGTERKGPSRQDCPHCDFKASNGRAFYAHMRSHVQFRNYLCEYCGSRFETSKDANRHSSWKHSSMPAKIIYMPLIPNEDVKIKPELKKETEMAAGEPAAMKTCDGDTRSEDKPITKCYSCCHCSIKGLYPFVEEHLKAQHRDLPFLLRKEEGEDLYLEVYKYRCGHCSVDSDSLMEAMDHWVKNHVTLDFKFSLCLYTSTFIKRDTSAPSMASVESAAGTSAEPISLSTVSKTETSSPSKSKKKSTTAKPDSSIPSDFDDTTGDDLESSFSSVVEGGTDSELDQQVSSSTSSEQELWSKCGYCRKISKEKNAIIEHISVIHKGKPVKISLYQKDDHKRRKRESSGAENVEQNAREKRVLRGSPRSPKGRICYRCDVCSHVVKVRKSIVAHLNKVHPGNSNSFTKIEFESDVRPPTKHPFKCNYCGDTTASLEGIKAHHAHLHDHLLLSYTNMRDEALSYIHKPSSVVHESEGMSSPSCGSSTISHVAEAVPNQSPRETSSVAGCRSPVIGCRSPRLGIPNPFVKRNARKSFPMKFSTRKQIATKSTSGRLQLVRLVKSEDDACEGEPNSSFSSVETVGLPCEEDQDSESVNFNKIYAIAKLVETPMRLSVTQLSAVGIVKMDAIVRISKEDREMAETYK